MGGTNRGHSFGVLLRAARKVLSAATPEDVFSAEPCLKIAGAEGQVVLVPAWHGFVDVAHFQAAEGAAGGRVEPTRPSWKSCAGLGAKKSGPTGVLLIPRAWFTGFDRTA